MEVEQVRSVIVLVQNLANGILREVADLNKTTTSVARQDVIRSLTTYSAVPALFEG